jgi:hypothetical protein
MKYPFFSERFFRYFLISVAVINAISAFAGGIALIFMDGLGMPKEWVNNSFGSFLIPGLVLFFIVGGTSLASAILVGKRWKYAMESAMVAGFGMQIWIYVEMYIIRQSAWLQTLYFSTGILVLILAFMLYGRKSKA